MVSVILNTKPISVTEINQLKEENELLKMEVVHFVKKYMETSSLLKEVEDKLFWADEVRRLCTEGLDYKNALEVAGLEKKIQKILREKGGI